MSRRLPIAVALIALVVAPWWAREARAQEPAQAPELDSAILVSLAQSIRLADVEQTPFEKPQSQRKLALGTFTLGSLYASTAVMQGLDIHSTLSVIQRGGGEGNPILSGLVKNKAAFIGVKAAVAAGTILAARRIAKRNKVAAVVTLVAINSAYAMVVQHNYKVARSLQ